MLTDDLPATLDRLVDLGRTPDVNIRPVLLRVLVDLFVSRPSHSGEAIRQFDEMVARLLDDADAPARLIVAGKLAGHPQAPARLLKKLIAERGTVAGTVLSRATLDAQTLQSAAVLGTAAMAAAVAQRPDLDAATVRALAERPEGEVVAALADNPAAPIDLGLQRYLVRRARDNAALAARLLKRGGDPGELAALFLTADRAGRAAILLALRRQELGRPPVEPAAEAGPALGQIEHIALRPGQDGLDLVLAHALSLPAPLAERLVDDPGGEPLAVALAALGASPELAARVFILGHPAIGRDYPRVRSLVGLVETLPVGVARRILASLAGEALAAPRRVARTEAERARPAAAAMRSETRAAPPQPERAARKLG